MWRRHSDAFQPHVNSYFGEAHYFNIRLSYVLFDDARFSLVALLKNQDGPGDAGGRAQPDAKRLKCLGEPRRHTHPHSSNCVINYR